MSTDNVINPLPDTIIVKPTVTPAPSSISSATLSELRVAFDRAIDERQQIDNRLEEIRTAVEARLAEAQSLRDAAVSSVSENSKQHNYRKSKIITSVDNSEQKDKESMEKKIDSDTFEFDLANIWKFLVNYIIPIAIIAALIWLGIDYANQNKPSNNDVVIPVTSNQSIDCGNEV